MKNKINIYFCDDNKCLLESYHPTEILEKLLEKEKYKVDYITINNKDELEIGKKKHINFSGFKTSENNVLVLDDMWNVAFNAKTKIIEKFKTHKVFIIFYSTFNEGDVRNKDFENLKSAYENNENIKFSEQCISFPRSSVGYRYFVRKVLDSLPKAEEFFNVK